MKNRLVISAIVLICVLGLAALILLKSWTDLQNPHVHTMVNKAVNIPAGSTTESTLRKLKELGIISDTMPLKIYIKLTNASNLVKAGDYYFPSPIAPLAVLQQLESGGEALAKLTIVEGYTRWDIADAMAALSPLKLKNSAQALALTDDTKLIADLDLRAKNLEGYMFPDTYFIQSDTTGRGIIEKSVERFHQVWIEKLAQQALSRKQSVHDIVTIASIIETEAKLKEERPVVASVIYNRLKVNMPLSVDSTIVYASKLAGKWKNDGKVYLSDVNRDSPYNTRKYAGLPPGPVSCPGLPSLEAALNPANTTYIYYVRNPARNDGAHNFYSDAAGFEKGVQLLRDWEKARDAALKKHAKK